MSARQQKSVELSPTHDPGAARLTRGAENMCIRTIGWRDWRKVAELFREIFPELTTDQISHYIRHYEDTIAVVEARGELVGFYQFTPKAGEATAWLNYFGVISSYYRSGVGLQLLRHYEEQAVQCGFCLAAFDVLQQNQKAIRFYEKHGYTRLYPVHDKFRYQKKLVTVARVSDTPRSKRRQSYLSRMKRRVMYLILVRLSLFH